jgi:hypothetical protein
MIDGIKKFKLSAVMKKESHLLTCLQKLETQASAFCVADSTQLRSLISPKDGPVPTIIVRSSRVPDGWAETICECDVQLDVFEADFMGSMAYLTWIDDEFAIGIPVESIAALLEDHPLADKMFVVWVTKTEVVVHSIDRTENFDNRIEVAANSWRLGRFILDKEYAATKMAHFPALLSDGEQRTVNERGGPLYIMESLEPLRIL